jgi:hypothetical protein
VQVGEHVFGAAGAIGLPWQSQVAVHVGEHVVAAGAGVTRDGVIGAPWQSQVAVHVGEHVVAAGGGVGITWPVGATIGLPWQSQVDVHVGKHVDVDAAIGRPAQSHVAVHVGEQRGTTIGLPEQSHVDVHCGEHLAAATMGLPEQSHVEVHCGEHLPAAFGEPAPTSPFAVLVPVVPVTPGLAAPAPTPRGVGATKAFLPATVLTAVGAVTPTGGAAVSIGVRAGCATLASSAVTTPVSSDSLLTSHPVRPAAPMRETHEMRETRDTRDTRDTNDATLRKDMGLLVPDVSRMLAAPGAMLARNRRFDASRRGSIHVDSRVGEDLAAHGCSTQPPVTSPFHFARRASLNASSGYVADTYGLI